MSFKHKIKIMLASLVLSQSVFAANDTPVKFAFVNNTDSTGSAFVYVTGAIKKGPIVEKNGGQGTMTFHPHDNQYAFVGLWLSSTGLGQMCLEDGGNVNLDFSAYKGDTITISFNKLEAGGGVDCTCTGSACGVSAKAVKKQV